MVFNQYVDHEVVYVRDNDYFCRMCALCLYNYNKAKVNIAAHHFVFNHIKAFFGDISIHQNAHHYERAGDMNINSNAFTDKKALVRHGGL